MYCSVENVKSILPKNITIGTTNIGNPVFGQTTNQSVVTPERVIEHIKFAQQQIDSRLLSFYSTPLRRIKIFEASASSQIPAGSSVSVSMFDVSVFNKGDVVEVRGRWEYETTTVESVTNDTTIVLASLTNSYEAEDALVSILKFPDPIPIATARLAASYIFDELFSADQSPNDSKYGNMQRDLANNDIDSILSGTVRLFGQEMTGRRFVRGTLFDAYSNPTKDFQFGREKRG
jgi:hypothetical protein